jgi:8-oxo-dGTP diphosphatase
MNHSVSAIIFNEDRTEVLLVKRRDIPVWVLPGGGIDAGESPEEAALREASEETGFTLEIARQVAEYFPVNKLTKLTYFYECKIVSGKAQTSLETQAICFFPLTELPKLLPPPYPGWIRDAAANHSKVLRKKIAGVSYLVCLKLLIKHPVLVGRFILTKFGIHINGPFFWKRRLRQPISR